MEPGTKFTYDGKSGVVVKQIMMFVAPGKRDKPIDNYRVQIDGSPIQYLQAKAIRTGRRVIRVEEKIGNHGPLYDEDCELRCFIMEPNLIVAWLLMASYAYYIEDDPILSDSMYDKLSRAMAKHYDQIKHWHKPYVPAPEEGGSVVHLHTLAEYEYPARIVGGLNHIRKYGANPVDSAIELGMVPI